MQSTHRKSKNEGPSQPPSGAPAFSSWEMPGQPRVELHLNVVEGIAQSVGGLPGQWTDTAGILLGRRRDSKDCPIIVEDYASLPSRRRVNAQTYTEEELAALEALMGRWRAGSGQRIEAVGLYRSALMGSASVTREDARLFEQYFPQPDAVFLFIYASHGRLLASFLSREEGRLVPPWGRPSFPFNRRELAGAPSRELERSNPPGRDMFPEAEEMNRGRLPGAEWRPVIGRTTAWAIGGALAAGLFGLGALAYRALPASGVRESVARPARDGGWLDLRAERTGAEWQLHWNRDAAIVQSASNGRFEIVDGGYRKTLALDANDLRTGHLVYAPATDDVSFRLEVFDSTHQRTLGESVRAAAGGPAGAGASPGDPLGSPEKLLSAVGDLVRAPAPATRSVISRRPYKEELDRLADDEDAFATHPSLRSAQVQRRAFKPPVMDGRIIVAKQNVLLPSPPQELAQDAAPQFSVPLLFASSPAAVVAPPGTVAPPQPKIENLPAPPSASAGNAATEAEVAPAVLLRKAAPVYPQLARQTRMHGVIQVTAKIDIKGRTKDIRTASGPIMLQHAAANAVREFVFQPAMLHGRPVESEVIVEIRFNLDH